MDLPMRPSPHAAKLRHQRQLTRNVRNEWGGWGSNPRPADYENDGPLPRLVCLR